MVKSSNNSGKGRTTKGATLAPRTARKTRRMSCRVVSPDDKRTGRSRRRTIGHNGRQRITDTDVVFPPPKERMLLTFGWNDFGQVGVQPVSPTELRKISEQHIPKRVGQLDGIKSCNAGPMHTVATNSEGRVLTWGTNDEGQLGRKGIEIFPGLTNSELGTVHGGRINNSIENISAGLCHTLLLSTEGELFIHGKFRASNGKLFSPATDPSEKDCAVPVLFNRNGTPCMVASGEEFAAILTKEGGLYTFGIPLILGALGRGELTVKMSDSVFHPRMVDFSERGLRFIHVACGKNHLLAIAEDRYGNKSVWGTGHNSNGQLGLGDTKDRDHLTRLVDLDGRGVKYVSCGEFHSACTNGNTCWTFGLGARGQLGTRDHCGGYQELRPIVVDMGEERVDTIACGGHNTILKTRTNKVFAFGDGSFGCLGNGSENDEMRPKEINLANAGFKNVEIHSLHAGTYHSAIVCDVESHVEPKSSGSIYGVKYDPADSGESISSDDTEVVMSDPEEITTIPIDVSALVITQPTANIWGRIAQNVGWRCAECFISVPNDKTTCVACGAPVPLT